MNVNYLYNLFLVLIILSNCKAHLIMYVTENCAISVLIIILLARIRRKIKRGEARPHSLLVSFPNLQNCQRDRRAQRQPII